MTPADLARTFYAGIDPGREGGLVAIDNLSVPIFKSPLPFLGGLLDIRAFCEIVEHLFRETRGARAHFVMEEASIRPGQRGAVAFVRSFANMEGAVAALGYSVETVKSSVWTRAMFKGLPASLQDKERSIYLASRLWPEFELRFPGQRPTTKNANISDATLLAEWKRRQTLGV